MGTWGPGPFESDAAANFLDELHSSPARFVAKTLGEIVERAPGQPIDVDAGGAGWAACELVALAFGRGDPDGLNDAILDAAAKLKAREEQRLLAVTALPRIADRAASELARLWHEGSEGSGFDASLAQLGNRLAAASEGPRELPRAKKGDVIGFPAPPDVPCLFAVQVVGPGEVAVFQGIWPDEAAALAAAADHPARRVPTAVSKLLRRGRMLGNRPVRSDLTARKLYADETGALESYALMTACVGGLQIVSYEEARDHDRFWRHGEEALLAVARGTQPVARVRSVDEREAELRARNAENSAARREASTPGPFGDVARLESMLHSIESTGIANVIRRFHDEATGLQGYGRPNEDSERGSYAFAGLVALWRGTWSKDRWPAGLAARLPAPPDDPLMVTALAAARILAGKVITRDAALRLIWDGAPDQGADLRRWVAELQGALSDTSG
jgi:hypothetical protein